MAISYFLKHHPEYIEEFYINENKIFLGEFNAPDQPISFEYRTSDTDANILEIRAEDYFGNGSNEKVELILPVK